MQTTRLLSIVTAFVLSLVTTNSEATTCSCAGVPLLGAMELATPGEGKWYVAGTYEFHDASELVSGSTTIPDATGRDRTSEVLMIETSRRLFGNLSFSALLATVKHDRTVGGVHDSASGVGDGIVIVCSTIE